MKLLDEIAFSELQNSNDYDVRKSHNARWIDQKCTPDILTIVADCILEYLSGKTDDEGFSSIDVWQNEYTVRNVSDIFKKPSPSDKAAKCEYDKFFQQPMELFSYAGILEKSKNNRRNRYVLKKRDLLEAISLSEHRALDFLIMYITKVLSDSGLLDSFSLFFSSPNPQKYKKVKEDFTNFTQAYTPIKGNLECWRIFIKVLNPLAYSHNSVGTERGHLSKDAISYDMLMYNRDNFRDVTNQKPKGVARQDFCAPPLSKTKYIEYLTNKAIKYVKFLNKKYNHGYAEMGDNDKELATEVHHIFPRSEFPEISHYIENLISLTPNQHRNHAHPNGDYSQIDKEFQKLCLISKIASIKNYCEISQGDYSFSSLLFVIGTGYRTKDFASIKDNDFDELILRINNLSQK